MVNTRSRSNHDFSRYENPNTALAEFFKRMDSNLEEIVHSFKGEQLDIDNFLSEQGVTGQISLADQVRTPFKITDMFAVWNASAFPTAYQRAVAVAGASAGPALPAGYSLTGFIVTALGTATATTTTVTVSGLAGNNQTYEINLPVNGSAELQINFPTPIPAANAAATPIVTFNGNANTGAATVVIFGVAPTTVTIQVGQRFFFPNPAAGQFQLTGLTNGLQVLMRDVVSFQVTPPVACMFETIGTADYRKVDRQ